VNFKNAWRGHVQTEIEGKGYGGLNKVVRDKESQGFYGDGDWSRLARPQGLSEDLRTAVEIACGDFSHPYVRKFLDWAIEGLEKALSDSRFESDDELQRGWKIAGIYPGNHGQVLSATALAQAMRSNTEIDASLLVQGAREIAETELEAGSYWSQAQSGYMRAINLFLIAGEVAEAKTMFKTRKKFAHTQQHFDWLKTFVMAIPDQSPNVLTDPAMHQHFQGKFDMYRNPAYVPLSKDENGGNWNGDVSLLRLELALIKHRYLLGRPLHGEWETIIQHISE
jgi:hypothetical protein